MKREQEIFPYIAQLLNGAEVEWKPLGKVTEVKTGQSVNKNIIADNAGEYPVINSGREPLGFINVWNTDNDPIGITSRGAGVGSVTWQEGKYFRGNLNYSVSIKDVSTLNTRFLYHLLLQMQPEIHALCTFEGIPALNAVNLKKLQIPLPSLFVQQEIVRILDKFTQLEAELEAELDCRKRQYEYYRDKLLTSDENQVEWKKLGEVLLSVKTGLNPRRFFSLNTNDAKNYYITIRELKDGKIIPSDKTDRINDEALKLCQKRSNLEIGDVLFSGTGTIGEMAIIKEEPSNWNIKEGVYALKPNHSIITSGYIRYILSSQKIKDKIISKSAGGTVKSISMKELQLIQIPIPPIEEQERIAGILDKFDTLVNSISEGLPREIELRRKQYEYYREKLLSFPKN
jgi:putative type I restriction-modification system specificity protein